MIKSAMKRAISLLLAAAMLCNTLGVFAEETTFEVSGATYEAPPVEETTAPETAETSPEETTAPEPTETAPEETTETEPTETSPPDETTAPEPLETLSTEETTAPETSPIDETIAPETSPEEDTEPPGETEASPGEDETEDETDDETEEETEDETDPEEQEEIEELTALTLSGRYISGLALVWCENIEEAEAVAQERGFEAAAGLRIRGDEGGLYLLCQSSDSTSEAVTGLALRSVEGATDGFADGRIEYSLLGSLENGYALYFTTSTAAGSPIMALAVSDTPTSELAETLSDEGGAPVNLSTIEGAPLYIHHNREKTLYVSSVIFATAPTVEEAKKQLVDRGYTIFDVNLNDRTGFPLKGDDGTFVVKPYPVYMGYMTTTDESRALTDLRVRQLTPNDMNAGESAIFVENGITYMGAPVAVGNSTKMSNSIMGASMYLKPDDYWDESTLAGTVGTAVANFFLSLFSFGITDLIKWLLGGDTTPYTTVFMTRDPRAGTPILADFIYTREEPVQIEGYEPVSRFCSSVPVDFTGVLNESGNPCNYLYFKTGITYTDGPEYLSDIVSYRFDNSPTPSEMTHYEARGFTLIDGKDWFQGTGGYLYIAYKTTKNPYRALTDIKFYPHPSTTHSYDDAMGARDTTTYHAATCYSSHAMPVVTGADKTTSIEFRYDVVRKKYNDVAAFFVTSSPSAGDPIVAEFLISDGSPLTKIPDGYSAVTKFKEDTAADVTKNSSCPTDRFLYFKRNPAPGPEKYYSEAKLIWNDTLLGAQLQCLNEGYDGFIDLDTQGGSGNLYLLYNTTASKSEAITDFALTKIDFVWGPYQITSWGYSYENAPQTFKAGSIDYTLAGEMFKPAPTNGVGYSGVPYALYYTKSARSGSPLVDIGADELLISNNYDETLSLYTDNVAVDITNRSGKYWYMHYTREKRDATTYIGTIVGGNGGSWNSAMRSAIANGGETINRYVEFDFNHSTGADYVIVGYSLTENPNNAITGLVGVYNVSYSETIEVDGILYYAVSRTDFNVGTRKPDIWLYYTRDPRAGAPLTSLAGSEETTLEGYAVVMSHTGDITQNFKRDTGKSAYLHYTRYDSQSAITASVFSDAVTVLLVGIPLLALVGGAGLLIYRKRKRTDVK